MLSIPPRTVYWSSLSPAVQARMEGKGFLDRGLTEVQALALEVRCRLGLSRPAFVTLLGPTSPVTVYRWETGRSVPSTGMCWRLAAVARDHQLPEQIAARWEELSRAARFRPNRRNPWR